VIPQSFNLCGMTIKVELVPDLVAAENDIGQWIKWVCKIRLQSIDRNHCRDAIEQAFYHELVHAMLELSGYKELSADEALVDRLGHLLYQFDKTATEEE
jgi:hypothetical protein